MSVHEVSRSYLQSVMDIGNVANNSWKKNALSSLAVISLFTLVIPFIFIVGYRLTLKGRVSRMDAHSNKTNDVASHSKPFEKSIVIRSELHPEQKATLRDPMSAAIIDDMIKNQKSSSHGYSMEGIDLLLMSYLSEEKSAIFLGRGKGDSIKEEEVTGKIAYTSNFKFTNDRAVGDHKDVEELTHFLQKEILLHPEKRPAKIFINCGLFIPGKLGHAIILVVEPDAGIKNKANITMVNTHGDAITSYHSMEHMILAAAKKAYDHDDTKYVRNLKATFSGGFCGIDAVENVRHLASISDVQKHIIQNQLPLRGASLIGQRQREHAVSLTRLASTLSSTIKLDSV